MGRTLHHKMYIINLAAEAKPHQKLTKGGGGFLSKTVWSRRARPWPMNFDLTQPIIGTFRLISERIIKEHLLQDFLYHSVMSSALTQTNQNIQIASQSNLFANFDSKYKFPLRLISRLLHHIISSIRTRLDHFEDATPSHSVTLLPGQHIPHRHYTIIKRHIQQQQQHPP